MADRLVTRAGGIDVASGVRAEDGEGTVRQALWGDVDVGAVEGRGGGEEDGLVKDPGLELGSDCVVDLHTEGSWRYGGLERERNLSNGTFFLVKNEADGD